MKIMLIGGGSGGHITPLLAVAHELKELNSNHSVAGVCEKGSRFKGLYENSSSIDSVFEIRAGKYRRYGNETFLERLFDIKTNLLNIRDFFLTTKGYFEAVRLLKSYRPDAILAKGGFVCVPTGLAAARLGIPFITHDSDSVPGLANRIIGKWAKYNATGMPVELYDYPSHKVKYVGIPLSDKFNRVTATLKKEYRRQLGIDDRARVITIVGGSLGGDNMNRDVASISDQLFNNYNDLVILHIAGSGKEEAALSIYRDKLSSKDLKSVKVFDFVDDVYRLQGAADLVVARAGATMTAELSVQGLPIIIMPADLASSHQRKNADLYASKKAAIVVNDGDEEGLYKSIQSILGDSTISESLSDNIQKLSKNDAAKEMADLLISLTN